MTERPRRLDLATITRGIGRGVELRSCHAPGCGSCASCAERTPLSRELFRDVLGAARRGSAEQFHAEVGEARDRRLAARRADEIAKLAAAAEDLS